MRSEWDLVIVDEAHKMSAYRSGADGKENKTLAYQLGEALSQRTDHYLLMTATPHKGDPQNFSLFLRLLDEDVYGDVASLQEAMRRQEAPFYLRRVKEALVTFPNPDSGEVKTLFTRRDVRTIDFKIDDRGVGLLRHADPLRGGAVGACRGGQGRRARAGPSASPWPCCSAVLPPASTRCVGPWSG
ncbi:MAG: hypothetical protein V9H69_17550 [Anaerolineae bacterium]